MNRNLLIGVGVFLAVVIAGFFIVRSPKTAKVTGPTGTGPVKEISVSAKEYAFTPASISVNRGDNVKITFTNDGTVTHNLTFSELGVKTDTISPGEKTVLEFTADKAGTFEFHCSMEGHKDQGMQGTLTVN